jgi:hypothetical protein
MRVAGLNQLHLFRRGHKPERPPPALEFALAAAFADTLKRVADPDWFWTHFPAGEKREAITGARLHRMGLKPGVADYLFLSPDGRPHFLELKRRRGGELSQAQEDFRDWCKAHGVIWRVARTYDQAIAIVSEWGVLKREVKPQ